MVDWLNWKVAILDDSFTILKYNVFIDRAQNCMHKREQKIEQRLYRSFQTMFWKTMIFYPQAPCIILYLINSQSAILNWKITMLLN
jgi:hypothetical protein